MENNTELTVLNGQNLTNRLTQVRGKWDIRKYWDRDTMRQMIENIKDHREKMLVTFLWMSGLRISEAVGLRKGDVDFQNYVMRARWLKSRKYKERIVPLHPHLRDLLQLYSAAMLADDRLFPITRQRGWQIVKKRLGGHPHMIRHSFAVNWLRSGADVVTLHRVLGHSKIQTTMEYLKIVPTDQGRELLKVEF